MTSYPCLAIFATGEDKMNVTGLVKYVGKLGANGSSMFVGLKLDPPGRNHCHYN